jgi:serine protease Do
VIGINPAVNAAAQGIGFAIPINTALEVKEELITTGRIRRAYMGVSLTDVSNLQDRAKQILRISVDEGAVITRVEPDSPAAQAGLEVYDVITQIGETQVKSAQDVTDTIAKYKPGDEVVVIVLRQGRTEVIPVVLGERPPGI